MSNKSTAITRLSFFAAANGYSGFRSYFDKIFDPSEYTSLYILKGGPGTGKSSFMKRLLAELETEVEECEAIFCSSDPASLDGVIIKRGERRIGVIDGIFWNCKFLGFCFRFGFGCERCHRNTSQQ